MNDLPRRTLSELVVRYGPSLGDDPRRTEGLLRDFCGEHKREIFVLVSAAEEQVPADLLALQDSVPHKILLAQLTRRLQDNLALARDAARWGVESWALALGMIQQPLSGPLPQVRAEPARAAVPTVGPRLLHTLEAHEGWVHAVAFSPDGHLLASGSQDRTVRVWDVSNVLGGGAVGGSRIFPEEPGFRSFPVTSVAFSSDGRFLAWGSEDGGVHRWDLLADQGVQPELRSTAGAVCSVVISPDGRLLAVASANLLILWNLAGNGKEHYLQGHTHLVQDVAFSPDGQVLASAGGDKTVRLWDAMNRREIRSLLGHREAVWSVAFSPDGRTLASGSADRTVRLWDVAQGRMVERLGEHAGGANGVTFSPDGRILAVASSNSVVLWDVAKGQEIDRLRGHTHLVESVAFSPEGRILASGSWDETARLWRVDSTQ
jgi:WD40 repeat protein